MLKHVGIGLLATGMAVTFGAFVYWLVGATEPVRSADSMSTFVCGTFTTYKDSSGPRVQLQLHADGTCSRSTFSSEGRQRVLGTEESGRWSMTDTGALALSWEGGLAEPVALTVDERGYAELRAGGQVFTRLVTLDCN